MAFRPKLGDQIILEGARYFFAEHPVLKGFAYGQTGRRGTVFQLTSVDKRLFALKVFTHNFQSDLNEKSLGTFNNLCNLPGLEVCQRSVISPNRPAYSAVLKTNPELTYAVLMPWVKGKTWQEVIQTSTLFTKTQSWNFAESLLKVLLAMESHQVAHCDLAGSNIILNFDETRISLVDIEEMYAQNLARPAQLSKGSEGYAHKSAVNGLWTANADRFAGGILIAEMLAQHDQRFRDKKNAESYFSSTEMQIDTPRYQLLRQILQESWGLKISTLFENVWNSQSLNQCPKFQEWTNAIGINAQAIPAPTSKPVIKPAWQSSSQKASIPLSTPTNSTSTNKVSPGKIPPGGPVVEWTQLGQGRATLAQSTPRPTVQPSRARTPVKTVQSTQNKGFWSGRAATIFWIFATISAITFAGILTMSDQISPLLDYYQHSPAGINFTIGSTLLATLLGLIQIWVFHIRIQPKNRKKFVFASIMSGIIAGVFTGVVLYDWMGIQSSFLIGLSIGGIAGGLSSIWQNNIFRTSSTAGKWFSFNFFTWALIWSVGWAIGWNARGPIGFASGGAFILLLSGIALSRFLHKNPDVEF
jgi:serine/threonine protein kinase